MQVASNPILTFKSVFSCSFAKCVHHGGLLQKQNHQPSPVHGESWDTIGLKGLAAVSFMAQERKTTFKGALEMGRPCDGLQTMWPLDRDTAEV